MGCGKSMAEKPKLTSGLQVNTPTTRKENPVLEVKIVLLGDTGVGKSSISTRFSQNKFQESHEVTIGGAYFQHQIALANGSIVKMHIWDTGGAERFRSLTPMYYKDSIAAIITYDITHSKTLNAAEDWLRELGGYKDLKKMVLVLAANKCDMEPEDKFIIARGKQIAEKNGMIFKQTSAKTGAGIQELFRSLTDAVCTQLAKN